MCGKANTILIHRRALMNRDVVPAPLTSRPFSSQQLECAGVA